MPVTIRWTQRAAGRDVGEVETVERSVFVDGVIAAGRVEVLSETADPELDKADGGAAFVKELKKRIAAVAEESEPAVEADSGATDPE